MSGRNDKGGVTEQRKPYFVPHWETSSREGRGLALTGGIDKEKGKYTGLVGSKTYSLGRGE